MKAQTKGFRFPGFFDLQVNGFQGVDFTSPQLSKADFLAAAMALLDCGIAGFLPTLITSPADVYQRNLGMIASALAHPDLAGRVPGIHVEGPFISAAPGYVGAHNPDHVRAVDIEFLGQLQAWADGRIRLLTLAPELPGAVALIEEAVRLGMTVSAGHCHASQAVLAEAAAAGLTGFTHLGNGLPNALHRHDNPIWAALAEDRIHAMMIADGHHLPAPVLKGMIRAKTPGRVIMVSDAAPLSGMPPGRYETLGNKVVLEPSGRLYNPDKQCLVGSSVTLIDCMNHLAGLGFLSPEELMKVGLDNPLAFVGLNREALNAVGESSRSFSQVVYDPAANQFQVVS